MKGKSLLSNLYHPIIDAHDLLDYVIIPPSNHRIQGHKYHSRAACPIIQLLNQIDHFHSKICDISLLDK